MKTLPVPSWIASRPSCHIARRPSLAIPGANASAVVSKLHSAPIVVLAVAAQGTGKHQGMSSVVAAPPGTQRGGLATAPRNGSALAAGSYFSRASTPRSASLRTAACTASALTPSRET